jgi:hypothetical protein
VEPYNICNEYIVNPSIGVSTILDSTNIVVQVQIMPTHEFHSLLQIINNEQQFIYDDVCVKKTKSKYTIFTLRYSLGVQLAYNTFALIQFKSLSLQDIRTGAFSMLSWARCSS